MCKVMIIDDEKAIRSLLRITIEKLELGVEIVGEAASGIEAINTMDNYKPDILFVDIRMPFMDGIEFSKIVVKNYPSVKIIILSAFNDFEYARQCIGIGVCEYLLKPIVREEIRETLVNVIAQVKENNEEEEGDVVDDNNNAIQKIKNFITTNYQDPEINLTSIAQKFGFNSSYLSRLFKSKTGIGLNDFITQCRMEKAVNYAKKGNLMYITAKEVGIPDSNYFGKCFKKFTGKAYSEYVEENKDK